MTIDQVNTVVTGVTRMDNIPDGPTKNAQHTAQLIELRRTKTVLCAQEKEAGYFFAVVELETGVAAVWENHAQIVDSVDALKAAGILNQHELQLLQFSAGA